MKLRKLTYTIGVSVVDAIIKLLSWVAYGALGMIILIVFSNVLGRFLLHKPVLGTIELVEIIVVIFAFFAMPYTALKRGHIHVELVISRLSRRTQAILGSIVFFLSAVIFAFITYQGSAFAIAFAKDLSQATAIWSIPFAPFRFVMVLGCLLLCLKLLVHAFQPLPPKQEQKGGLSK